MTNDIVDIAWYMYFHGIIDVFQLIDALHMVS